MAPDRQRLGQFAIACLTVALAALWCMVNAGCGYARHIDPPLYRYDSALLAEMSARAHAAEIPGRSVHQNLCCGSMRPVILEGDWIVTAPTLYGDHLLGRLAVYRPKWNQGKPVLHRLVSGNARDGFIASGDNNPRSEATERVTAANYDAEVIGIYRFQK